MCLDKLHALPRIWRVGWKIFEFDEAARLLPLYGVGKSGLSKSTGKVHYPPNTWIKDQRVFPLFSIYYGEEYQNGFHFYREKEAALIIKDFINKNPLFHTGLFSRLIVEKVKIRKLTATGIQSGYKVGVAKEIFICKS